MYYGGKNGEGVMQAIINQIPPHRIYIEPFLGSGAIIKNKKPALRNVGIEIDKETIDTFHSASGTQLLMTVGYHTWRIFYVEKKHLSIVIHHIHFHLGDHSGQYISTNLQTNSTAIC